MADSRLFFPLDSLQEIRDALGDHVSPCWRSGPAGSPSVYLGMLPCPCQTHLEPYGGGLVVWHGCGTLELPAELFEDYSADRDQRILSAICNWLVDVHQEPPR